MDHVLCQVCEGFSILLSFIVLKIWTFNRYNICRNPREKNKNNIPLTELYSLQSLFHGIHFNSAISYKKKLDANYVFTRFKWFGIHLVLLRNRCFQAKQRLWMTFFLPSGELVHSASYDLLFSLRLSFYSDNEPQAWQHLKSTKIL